MQGKRKTGCEEQRDRQHVRRIVMEVQVLVPDVRHPIEMGDDPVREAMPPRAQQERTYDHQGDIGQDRKTECDRDVISDPEFSADFNFPKSP